MLTKFASPRNDPSLADWRSTPFLVSPRSVNDTKVSVNQPLVPFVTNPPGRGTHNLRSVKTNCPPPSFDERSAEDILRFMLSDPDAEWNGDAQKWAVGHLFNRANDLLLVVPTGWGKSFLAAMVTLLEDDLLTLIAVPLLSLLDDYKRRLVEMDIPFHVYNPKVTSKVGLSPDIRIVLTTVNHVPDNMFRETIKVIHSKTPFGRIIVDEAHIGLTAADYRPEFTEADQTRIINVPIALLTATCPPHLAADLVKLYRLTDSHIVIRTPTDRPEFQFNVQNKAADAQELSDRVETIVQGALATMKKEDRILIFASSKEVGQLISDSVQCPFYHAGEGVDGRPKLSPTEQSSIPEQFIAGTNRTMVCTSAYGAGNDYAHIRYVIHAGTPAGMIDFIQEVGRGGRDHLPARSIVIPLKSTQWILKEKPEDVAGVRQMIEYLSGADGCRRSSLNTYNDGTARRCKVLLSVLAISSMLSNSSSLGRSERCAM